MKPYVIKNVKNKGKGLFASRDIKKGEHIVHTDLTKLKSYSIEEINANPKLQSNHCNYVGNGRYVVEYNPSSYMNHFICIRNSSHPPYDTCCNPIHTAIHLLPTYKFLTEASRTFRFSI